MSLGEADAKFPDSTVSGLPPSPSRENPGQVFPKTDPAPASPPPTEGWQKYMGNPYLMQTTLQKLEHSLNEAISVFEKEQGAGTAEGDFLGTLRGWRTELERHFSSRPNPLKGHAVSEDIPPKREGGMFTD
ncbi:hypothetical protein HGRIS_006735 [Hohenbuehelia grisea]|uniref:Uncharacterized protein n=1 Tax=Hohenbuehelia grisea TaxID=104357 RepID=A0ABR3JA60_9AGAR